MQKRDVFEAAPVSAIKTIAADEIQGPGDPSPLAGGHDQQHLVTHALSEQGKEPSIEIGAPPFAGSGIHVEGEKGVPEVLAQVRAGELSDRQTSLSFPPLPADG